MRYLRQSFARLQNLQRCFFLLFPYHIRRPLTAPRPHSASTSLSVCPSTFPRAYFMPLKSGAWRRSAGWHTAPLIPLHIAPPFRSIHPSIPRPPPPPPCHSCFICLMMRCHRSALEWARIRSDKKCLCLCVQRDCLFLYGTVYMCLCLVCVWHRMARGSDRHQDCAVTAGEEMIYLSGGLRDKEADTAYR